MRNLSKIAAMAAMMFTTFTQLTAQTETAFLRFEQRCTGQPTSILKLADVDDEGNATPFSVSAKCAGFYPTETILNPNHTFTLLAMPKMQDDEMLMISTSVRFITVLAVPYNFLVEEDETVHFVIVPKTVHPLAKKPTMNERHGHPEGN